jgi:uncharacterized protein (DUF2225 family)
MADEEYRGPHCFHAMSRLWTVHYCCECGHAAMKNELSQIVTKIGCGYKTDQRYKYALKRLHPRTFALLFK